MANSRRLSQLLAYLRPHWREATFGIIALFMDEMDPGWSHGTVREDGNAIGCEVGKLRPVRQHRVGRGTRRTGSLRVWTQHTPGRGEDSRLGRSKIPRGLMANRSAALAGTTTVRGMNRASFSREKDQTRGRAIRHHLWAPFAGWTLTV